MQQGQESSFTDVTVECLVDECGSASECGNDQGFEVVSSRTASASAPRWRNNEKFTPGDKTDAQLTLLARFSCSRVSRELRKALEVRCMFSRKLRKQNLSKN